MRVCQQREDAEEDDAAGGTGPKPIELLAVGLAGCTAFDVITIFRQKYHRKIYGLRSAG